MKTISLIQVALVLIAFAMTLEDTDAYMKRVRAAPKSRSDAEKRRLRYKSEQRRNAIEEEKKAVEENKARELAGIFGSYGRCG